MSIAKDISEIIGNSARYLLILFIGFLFIKIYFPQAERYIDVNLFFIITAVLLIIAIILEKKFLPERYKEYAEDEIINEEINEEDINERIEKISLTKNEKIYIVIASVAGVILIYYALSLNYPLLPFFLLSLLSITGGLVIAFLSYETILEEKRKS